MKKRGMKRQLIGTVVSDKMDKTRIVQVVRQVKHPLYKKYIRRRNNFSVHDPENACRVGDRVFITESRPLSRNKRWRLSKIIERAV